MEYFTAYLRSFDAAHLASSGSSELCVSTTVVDESLYLVAPCRDSLKAAVKLYEERGASVVSRCHKVTTRVDSSDERTWPEGARNLAEALRLI